MPSEGILYIATGNQFIKEARISAQSVTDQMPDVPIAIITDKEINYPVFDETIVVDDPEYGFPDQLEYTVKSPYNRTIRLDTDIYVKKSIYEVFDVLEGFDIAATHNHNRNAYEVAGVPDSFPEYNGGVLAYNNTPEWSSFISDWRRHYKDLRTEQETQVQPALRKALYESDLRIATLPSEYNLMLRYAGHAYGDIKVFHGRLIDIDTPGSPVKHNIDRAVEKINSESDHRVFIQKHELNGREIVVYTDQATLPHRLRSSIERDGIRGTVLQIFKRLLDLLPMT